MEKKPLIIRCSDGWIYGLFGYYEEAEEAAKQQTAAEQKEELAEEKETASASVPEAPEEEAVSIPEEEEPVFQLDFRVWGTRKQIMALREYMVRNQIRFGKVE